MGLWFSRSRRARSRVKKAASHSKFRRKSPRVDRRLIEARRYNREFKREVRAQKEKDKRRWW